MSDPVRVGLIGCGRAAERIHAPALSRAPGVRLAAVADPVRARADFIAATAPGCRVFDSAEELMRSGEVSAIIIASPPALHLQQAVAALCQGISALVEKPLATSTDGLDELESAAASSSAVLRVGFNRRYWEPARRLRRSLSGRADTPASATLRIATDPGDWGAIVSAGDPLENLGTHQLDLVRFVFDAPIESISASWLSPDAIEMQVKLRGGIVAEARAEHGPPYSEWMGVEAGDRRYRIWSGSQRATPARGAIRTALDVADALTRRLRRRLSPLRLSYDRQLAEFIECVRAGASPSPGLAEGVAVVRAVEAVRRSAATGGAEVALLNDREKGKESAAQRSAQERRTSG